MNDRQLSARQPHRRVVVWGCDIHCTPAGGTVILGVAWFDQAFFDDRRDAWFGAMHTRIYQRLGIPLDNITVTHWAALAS